MNNSILNKRRRTDKLKRTLVKLMDFSIAVSLILMTVYCYSKAING